MSIPRIVKAGSLEIGSGIPKICVPVVGRTKEEIIEETKACVAVSPDLVEWRCDFFDHVNDFDAVKDVLAAISDILGQIPMIFTFRTAKEGGNKPIILEDYINLNLFVSGLTYAQIIDVEYFMEPARMKELIAQIKKNSKVVIASHHRFDKTPPYSYMMDILEEMEKAGADLPKLAVMPVLDCDVKNLMLAVNEATCGRLKQPVIAMAMGELGAKSRVSGEVFGSCITFGCVGKSSAPGQIPVEMLRKEMLDLHRMIENISFLS